MQCVAPSSQTLTVNCFGPCSSKTVARTRPFFSGARSALFSTRALSGVTVRVLCVQFVVPSSRLTQVCPRTFTLRLVYVLRVVLPFEPYNPDFCEPRTDAYGMRTACTRHAHNTHNARHTACTPHAHAPHAHVHRAFRGDATAGRGMCGTPSILIAKLRSTVCAGIHTAQTAHARGMLYCCL